MIYLDHNATSPLDPRVLAKMLPFLTDKWGNASSRDHAYGWDARDAVEEARAEVAELIHAGPREIFFTSGATESLALALHGFFPPVPSVSAPFFAAIPSPPSPSASSSRRFHNTGLLLSAVEHEAVLAPYRRLQAQSVPTAILPVDSSGNIDLARLDAVLRAHPYAVVCLMAANNETGTLFPIRAAAAIAHAHGALLLTDAAQALGRIPLDARADGFDLAAFSAHKLHGPQGIGALFVRGGRDEIALQPLVSGGGQEGGLRGGTLNVPAIVGFGEACRLARAEGAGSAGPAGETSRLLGLRDSLEAALIARCPEIRVNGDRDNRLANTANLCFPGIDARALIRDMHQVAASTRSACSSGSSQASHVLKAMGLSDDHAFASVRFSLGRFATAEEVARTVEIAAESYRKLRANASSSFTGS